MGAVSGGSLDYVHGFAEASTFSFLPEAVLECVGASVPFGCPRSVLLALWGVFVAPLVAGLVPSAAETAPRVMRPSPSVTSVGARRGPCKPVPFVVCLRDPLLWIRAWSRVVCSRLPRERLRLRGCSHEGSRVRLPRWWFRTLLPSSVPLRDLLPRARLWRRSCPLGRLASVGQLRASQWCRSFPLGRLDSVELLRAFLRRRLFPCGCLDSVELLRAFLRCRSFPRGRLEMERVVEGVDLERASRTVVVGDRSASLAPWCVARVDDGMLPGFSGQGRI